MRAHLEAGGEATFTPTGQVGLRHDGGDAETGTGVEVGAGIRYSAGALSMEGAVRALVAHEESGYEEWGVSGAIRVNPDPSGRGLSLTHAPTWGNAASGIKRLWSARNARVFAESEHVEAEGRLEATVGYQLVQVIRTRLRQAGDNASWTTLRRILEGHQRITATFRRADGATLHVRKATRAEPSQQAIYDALGIDPAPRGIRKTVVQMTLEHAVVVPLADFECRNCMMWREIAWMHGKDGLAMTMLFICRSSLRRRCPVRCWHVQLVDGLTHAYFDFSDACDRVYAHNQQRDRPSRCSCPGPVPRTGRPPAARVARIFRDSWQLLTHFFAVDDRQDLLANLDEIR